MSEHPETISFRYVDVNGDSVENVKQFYSKNATAYDVVEFFVDAVIGCGWDKSMIVKAMNEYLESQ